MDERLFRLFMVFCIVLYCFVLLSLPLQVTPCIGCCGTSFSHEIHVSSASRVSLHGPKSHTRPVRVSAEALTRTYHCNRNRALPSVLVTLNCQFNQKITLHLINHNWLIKDLRPSNNTQHISHSARSQFFGG